MLRSAYGLGFCGFLACAACGSSQHRGGSLPAADGGVKDASAGSSGTSGQAGAAVSGKHWQPAPGLSWQYQLQGTLDTGVDADVFDIDLFNNAAEAIAQLRAQQRTVVCYFDTAYESYRDDSKQLEPYKGNPIDGWPGQYWVDFRAPAVLDVMKKRIEVAVSKGCDAVEADDVDARSNQPGFPIRAEDQQRFILALADFAHDRGLGFGLKNDLDEVEQLVSRADFAINEQCFEYDECDALAPFIAAGKAVFNVEYTDGDLASKAGQVCPRAKALQFGSIIKHLDLDAPRYGCK